MKPEGAKSYSEQTLASVLVENQKMEMREIPLEPMAADECRVALRAAGVCSSDIARGFEKGAYHYPLVMGHEMAGVIVGKGKDVGETYKVGASVAIFPLLPCFRCRSCELKRYAQCEKYDYYGSRRDGGFARELNVKSWNLLPMPKNVSFEQAATLEPVSVVVHAARHLLNLNPQLTRKTAENSILVLGAGFLGILTVRILRLLGCAGPITVADRNQFKLELLKNETGVTRVHLASATDWEKFVGQNRDHFAVSIEAVGAPETYQYSLDLAARAGTVVWLGNISGDLSLSKKQVSSVLRKELVICGTWNSSYDGLNPSDWTETLRLFAEGLRVDDLITHRISLAELPGLLNKLYLHKRRVERHEIIKAMVFYDK